MSVYWVYLRNQFTELTETLNYIIVGHITKVFILKKWNIVDGIKSLSIIEVLTYVEG